MASEDNKDSEDRKCPTFYDLSLFKSKFNFKVIYYLLCITFYIISFVYLFNYKSTEYIAYIITFILNCVFPFIWLEDLQMMFSKYGSVMMKYKVYSIYISNILVFLALFLVVITNEKVRKVKIKEYNDEKATNNEARPVDNLYTKDHLKEKRDKVILIIFITFIALTWGMIGETFSGSTTITSFAKKPYLDNIAINKENSFSKTIHDLLDLPHNVVCNADRFIHSYLDPIQATPLVKSFFIYSVTFISVFFGAFIRIPKHPEEIQNKMDRFQSVNMENVFTQEYERNYQQYRDLCIFVWSSLISISTIYAVYYIIPYALKNLTSDSIINTYNNYKVYSIPVIITFIFGLFFGLRNKIKDRKNKTKKLVMSVISLIFAFVGTPVVLGITQLICSILNLPSLNSSFTTGMSTLFLAYILIFIALFLFSAIYSSDKLLKNLKSMKMFIVVLVCMTISLFMSLMSEYNMFANLYNFIKILMEIVLVYLAPITVVILSIIQFVYSIRNHQKYERLQATD